MIWTQLLCIAFLSPVVGGLLIAKSSPSQSTSGFLLSLTCSILVGITHVLVLVRLSDRVIAIEERYKGQMFVRTLYALLYLAPLILVLISHSSLRMIVPWIMAR